MKFLNKPSHYLALLLTLTGGLLLVQGESVLPKEGPKKQRWLTQQEKLEKLRSLAKTHKSGQNDMLTSRQATTTSGHVEEGGDSPILAQLITLEGSVGPELYYPDSEEKVAPRTEPYPVYLELVWMDEGASLAQGVRKSQTDSKGNFDFKDLKPGAYRLRARPEDKDALHLPIAIDLEIPELEEMSPGEQPRFPVSSLILPLPRHMKGSVAWLNSVSGSSDRVSKSGSKNVAELKHLEGIQISVSEIGQFRGSAVADAEGKFKIKGVGDGPYTIRIRDNEGKDLEIAKFETGPQSKGEVPMLVMARQP